MTDTWIKWILMKPINQSCWPAFCHCLVSGSSHFFGSFLQAKSDLEQHNGRLQQEVRLLKKNHQLSSFDQQMICMHDSPPPSLLGSPTRKALSAITNTTPAATAQSKWADRHLVKPAVTIDTTDLKETPAAIADTMSLKKNHTPAQPAVKYMSGQDVAAAADAISARHDWAAVLPVNYDATMKTRSVLTSLTVRDQPARSGATDLNSYSAFTVSPSRPAVFSLSDLYPFSTAQSGMYPQTPKTAGFPGAATVLADSASPSTHTQACAGLTAEDWGYWGAPKPEQTPMQDSGFESRKHAVMLHGCSLDSFALQNGKIGSEQQCVCESDFAMSGQGTPEAAFSPGTHTAGDASSLLPRVEMTSSDAAAASRCVSTLVLAYPM